jgi:hypothetical protein
MWGFFASDKINETFQYTTRLSSPRKTVTRYIRWFIAPGATVHYHALYNMNTATAAQRLPQPHAGGDGRVAGRPRARANGPPIH